MGVLGAILGVLRALPEIIKLLGETIKWINEIRDRQKLEELKKGMQVARQTGDTSGIDAAFGGKKNEATPGDKPKP